MTKKLLAMVIPAVLFLGIIVLGCGTEESPSAVLEEFSYAQANNDCEKIIDLLNDESKNLFSMTNEGDVDPVEGCQQMFQVHPQEIEITSFETIEENIDGDTAVVKFKITGKVDGEDVDEEETINMTKEDGQWKVSLL